MKAWELQGFGLEKLKLVERPIPKPGQKQILVKVSAVSLNFRDKAILAGIYLPDIMKMPIIAVSDAAGIVVETGLHTTRFKVGDRVTSHLYPNWIHGLRHPGDVSNYALGGPVDGGLTEYLLLNEEGAVHTPQHLTDAEAATLPIAALTAWFALVEHGQLKAGQTVVTQGTGGVSLFAIQLASALGAHVIALSGSDEKLARVKVLGAAETINYHKYPQWHQQIRELTGGQGADHFLNIAGGTSLNKSVQAVANGGQVSVIGFLEDISASLDLLPIVFGAVKITGILVGHRDAFTAMNAVLEQQAIKPVIDTIYPFAEALAAYLHLDRGAFGKIVIKVD